MRPPASAWAWAVPLLALACSGAPTAEEEAPSPPPSVEDGAPLALELYFPTRQGGLAVERRQVLLPEEPRERVQAVVEALLAGPLDEEARVAPFPPEVSLGGVYLDEADGTAFIDLRFEGAESPPASGSRLERQRVYSLVNSVVLNVDGVEQVALLWNGRQRLTLAGHLDTSRPLRPDLGLVEDRAAAEGVEDAAAEDR